MWGGGGASLGPQGWGLTEGGGGSNSLAPALARQQVSTLNSLSFELRYSAAIAKANLSVY